jgi:D-xylose transport system permease protein
MAQVEDGLTGAGREPSQPGAEAEASPDLTAAAEVMPLEIVADSLVPYVRGWVARVRGGQSGVLPVALGLVIIAVAFEIVTPGHVFLTASNLVNLFIQSSVFMTLAMAESFVLLLGEIDLSVGYVAAVGGIVAADLVQKPGLDWPWWLAIIIGLASCAAIGGIQGSFVSRLHLPSFVVTLAGMLVWNGVMLVALGPSGGVSVSSSILVNQHALYNLVQGNVPPVVGWIAVVVIVGALGTWSWLRDTRRRRSGLVAPPAGVTVIKVVFLAIVGFAVVAVCNVNRGTILPVAGVPEVVPIVLCVLGLFTVLLQRTRFGRYVYAVGGNPEAARRAGISLVAVRTWCFILCSVTAGIAGLIYLAWQGGMNTSINGGQLVLYAVAAAVIGGTSLFGGRGKVVHGVLGGLVIGGIYNGLYLLGLQVQWQFIATGLVLLAAVMIDTLSRRGAMTGSVTRV